MAGTIVLAHRPKWLRCQCVMGVPRHGRRAPATRGGVAADGSSVATPQQGLLHDDEDTEGVAPGNERREGLIDEVCQW
jgi:hypothetical protein